MSVGLLTGSIDSPWVKSDEDRWERLAGYGTTLMVEPNGIIFSQGDRADAFYYLKQGRVKVLMFAQDGSEKTLAIHEEGSLFGETAAFDNMPRFATAVAMKRSEVVRIRANALPGLVRENPDLALRLMQSLCRKIRLLALQVEGMAFLDVERRVGHLLLRLAMDFGVPAGSGIRISVRVTDQELAGIVGSCRVTVTKVLNAFRRQGLVEKTDRYLIITDPAGLAQFVMAPLQPGDGVGYCDFG